MFRKAVLFFRNPTCIFWTIIVLTFIARIVNISYNSPANDEAVYIKIGLDALVRGQWALYNTASWVGGHPYFYPTVTAVAYFLAGINGSRILNILFSLVCLYFTGKFTFELALNLTRSSKLSQKASIIAVVLLGFSEVVSYTARLATYDMPSFMFFVASLYVLVKTLNSNLKTEEYSRSFLISSTLMALAFAFKYIVAIYIPVVLIISYLYLRSLIKRNMLRLWLIYFVMPLVLFILAITLTQVTYLLGYVGSQVAREASTYKELWRVFINEAWTSLVFWAFGVVVLIISKKWRFVLLSTFFILTIAGFHFLTLRISAWDKHIFFIVFAFCVTAGIGLAKLVQNKALGKYIIFFLVIYSVFNLYDAKKFNTIWPDFRGALKYLSQNVGKDDTLLSEESSSVLLPSKVTTFDWFTYKNLIGNPAYDLALDDGYFKYIELSLGYPVQTTEYKSLEARVLNEMRGSYTQVYKDKYFMIYKLGI